MSAPGRDEIDRALALDAAWAERARAAWLTMMALAVFGDLKGRRIGGVPRLRKQALDSGERLRAALADRDWIPQPRERLKNALATAIALSDALDELTDAAGALDGGADRGAFCDAVAALRVQTMDELGPRANAWAALLDRRGEADDNR
ncbi:MAG: hypothetical protein M5U08_25210 [Burkholderiales bacterium]|nr:hypothetical protein [Burkholderiales bacterium]